MPEALPEKFVMRLQPEAYKTLASQLPKPGCPKDAIEAGFLCGIALVLEKLRVGFVIGE